MKEWLNMKSTVISYGNVQLTVDEPQKETVEANVSEGQRAMVRLAEWFSNSRSVDLNMSKTVPMFSADPTDPELLIREFRGKTQRGKFINGKFTAVETTRKPKKYA